MKTNVVFAVIGIVMVVLNVIAFNNVLSVNGSSSIMDAYSFILNNQPADNGKLLYIVWGIIGISILVIIGILCCFAYLNARTSKVYRLYGGFDWNTKVGICILVVMLFVFAVLFQWAAYASYAEPETFKWFAAWLIFSK